MRYRPTAAFLLRAEYRRVGSATDLDASGNGVKLRGQWHVANIGDRAVSITVAVDNLTNEVITPQTGLPMPGRMLRMGLRVD